MKTYEDYANNQIELAGIARNYYGNLSSPILDQVYRKTISKNISDSLFKMTSNNDFLLYTLLVSSISIVLSKYSGLRKVTIGIPILKSKDEKWNLDDEICNLVFDVDQSFNFKEYLLKTRKILLKVCGQETGESINTHEFFDIGVALSNIHETIRDKHHRNTIVFTRTDDGIDMGIFYDNKIQNHETIEKFVGYIHNTLAQLVCEVHIPIKDVSIYEKDADLNITQQNFCKDTYKKREWDMLKRFDYQSQTSPENIAVRLKNDKITYGELNKKSNQVANYLTKNGIKHNDVVSVCMEPSIDVIVLLLGIVKAGAVYLPMDNKYPKERINQTAVNMEPMLFILRERNRLSESDIKTTWVDFETFNNKIEFESSDTPIYNAYPEDRCVYIINTSGSTGVPKGTMVRYNSWMNLLNWYIEEFNFTQEDSFLVVSSISFDLTQKNLFAPLMLGACLHLMDNTHYDPSLILDYCYQNKISLLNCTPSSFYPLLNDVSENPFEKLQFLRYLVLGGEPIQTKALKEWIGHESTKAEIVNSYGPSECTDIVSFYKLKKEDIFSDKKIPIGKPIPNTKLYVVGENGGLVAPEIIGELAISGICVGNGYRNDSELTDEKFKINPFEKDNDFMRIYYTGDMVTLQNDGSLLFVGRKDDQLKIRGYRIECGEIEEQIKQHEAIEDAIVLKETTHGSESISVYAVLAHKTAPVASNLTRIKREAGKSNLTKLVNGLPLFFLNKSETDFVYSEIFEENIYFQHGITLEHGDTIFDIGANIGMFSIFCSLYAKNLNIFAFEPLLPIYQTLEKNFKLYDLNVKQFLHGISNFNGRDKLIYYPNVSIMSGKYADLQEDMENISKTIQNDSTAPHLTLSEAEELIANRLKKEEHICEMRTISHVIHEHNIEKIDLLKIDVEKSEMDILGGIQESDWEKVRQLVMEIHDIENRLVDIVSLLKAKGYSVYYEKSDNLTETNIYNLFANRSATTLQNASVPMTRFIDKFKYYDSDIIKREIREHLAQGLPKYMMPNLIELIDKFPINQHGKIDREALRQISSSKEKKAKKSQNDTQDKLLEIWKKAFDREDISIDDDFMDIGGHSLLAATIISIIKSEFNVSLSVADFFENTTIEKLSKVIVKGGESK